MLPRIRTKKTLLLLTLLFALLAPAYYYFSPIASQTLPSGRYLGENVGNITVDGYDGIYEKRSPTFIFRRGTSFNVDPGVRAWTCKGNCDNIAVNFVGWRNLNGGNPLDAGQRISFIVLDDDNDGLRTKFYIDNEEIQLLPQDNMWQEVTLTMSRRGVPRIYTEDSIGIIAETILPASEPNRCGEGTSTGACTTKEIGNYATSSFTSLSQVQANNEAWVRIKVQGRSQTVTSGSAGQQEYSGADIMLIMDVTGSMAERFKRNSAESTPSTTRFNAAKVALNTFIQGSQNNDYLGLGVYQYCTRYRSANGVPVSWSYRGTSSLDNQTKEYAALISPLSANNRANLTTYVNNLELIPIPGNILINICEADSAINNRGTSTGSGLTTALTQLTDILTTPSGSTYRSSPAGINNGPRARYFTSGQNIPRYVVLASDGRENVPPYALSSIEIDNRNRTIVETAKAQNVIVHTVLIGTSSGQATMAEIAAQTGGTFYKAENEDDLRNDYLNIRNRITEDNLRTVSEIRPTTSRIIERINTAYFEVLTAENIVVEKNNSVINSGYSVSERTAEGFTITLPEASDNDEYEILFKVRIKDAPPADTTINDPAGTSKIEYSNGFSENVDLGSVYVENIKPHFLTQGGGDVYSKKGLQRNELPSGQNFIISTSARNTGIFSQLSGPLNLGAGNLSLTNQRALTITYDTTKINYASLLNATANVRTRSNLNSITTAENGLYRLDIPTGSTTTLNQPLDYTSNRNKQHVVFIDGNLLLNHPITIPNSGEGVGNTGIMFIIRGNLAIHPSVTNTHGVFLVEGKIFTNCQTITTSGCNLTGSTDTNLTLEGSYISLNGGFDLRRSGTTNNKVTEKFVFRPDLLLFASNQIGKVTYNWQEIEPFR